MSAPETTAAPPRPALSGGPALGLRPLALVLLALAAAALVLALVAPAPPRQSPIAFVRALLANLLILAPGAALSGWALCRRTERDAEGRAQIPALSWALFSLGAGLLVTYAGSVVARWVAPPVSGPLLCGLQLAGALGLLALARRHRDARVVLEPQVPALALLAGLLLVIAFGVTARHRLFGGLSRFVVRPADAELLEENETAGRADRTLPHRISGMRLLGIHRYGPTAPRAHFTYRRKDVGHPQVRLAYLLLAPPGTTAELWQTEARRCGLPPRPGDPAAVRRLSRAEVPREVLGVPVEASTDRFNTLLLAGLPLPEEGAACLELRLGGEGAGDLSRVELLDLSHEDLSGWILGHGRYFFIPEGGAECHLLDAEYRVFMSHSNEIRPGLLLWGYFTQFVATTAAGGHYPAMGLLFLWLALLTFAATQLIIGTALGTPGPEASLNRRAAPYLLLGPLLLHLTSVVYLPTQSFAFPDAPYTVLLLGALALLLRRERWAFILLGCLAAFARYPGAYVLAVTLFAWWALNRPGRRWTRTTLLWAVAAGVGVILLLTVHYASTIGVEAWLKGIYFEVFPEHFSSDQGGVGLEQGGVPLSRRLAHFWLKLTALSGFTLLLWPLSLVRAPDEAAAHRRRHALLLVVITLSYAATLMAVQVPHSHYFQPMIYWTAGAGLIALGGSKRRWLVPALVLAFAGALWIALQLNEFGSALLHWLGVERIR